MKPQPTDALIVVDVQNDFLPNGALGVPDGDKILPRVRALLSDFVHNPRFTSCDHHPEDHISFSDHPEFKDGSWPKHCVQGTWGVKIHEHITPFNSKMVFKGEDPQKEAYSAFEGRTTIGTRLEDELKLRNVKRVYVTGLALDYCVKATALDAKRLGFDVVLVASATKAVSPETGKKALDELRDAGVTIES